jgi:hypothetical protein
MGFINKIQFTRLFFLLITIHLGKFSVGIGIENVNSYKNDLNRYNYIISFLPSIFRNSKEEIYQLITSRLVKIEKKGKSVVKDLGFIPYWIDILSDKIMIYDNVFYRILGTIYFMKEKDTKGLIIFNKKGLELFCIHRVKKKKPISKDFLLIAINILPFKYSQSKI